MSQDKIDALVRALQILDIDLDLIPLRGQGIGCINGTELPRGITLTDNLRNQVRDIERTINSTLLQDDGKINHLNWELMKKAGYLTRCGRDGKAVVVTHHTCICFSYKH